MTVDPGGTTGLARWVEGEWHAAALPYDDAQAAVHRAAAGSTYNLIVFESFHITGGTLKKGRGGPNDTIEFIGMARYLCRYYGVEFKTQSPADAKMFATDAKLRKLEWWSTSDHARDASRHLLLALVNGGHTDILAKLLC